ncbi:hypothetical protein TURU_060639 [Turdus rufiventris]|nr:hypothetical protein TURU_060639 [Turdus rufiventris]
MMTWRNPQTQHWEDYVEFVKGPPQVAELAVVVRAFEKFSEPINLVIDSTYVAGVMSREEQAVIKDIKNEHLFRNGGPGFPLGLFGRGDLNKSHVSDHDKPIREKLLAYAVVKALLRVHVNGEREFSMAPQRRLAYDADFKLKAINHAKQHGNRDAAREFNINESIVPKWRQQDDDLRLAKKTKKSFRGHKARWLQLEDRLERWISKQRPVVTLYPEVPCKPQCFKNVRIQAKAIANKMGMQDFKAGSSWCFRFMKRQQLSIRTRTTVSQRLPADYEEKVAMFRSYCKSKIAENNIQAKHIINMDEVPLTFDMPLTRTVERTGTPTVPVRTTGNEKSSFTVVLGFSSDGQKLSPKAKLRLLWENWMVEGEHSYMTTGILRRAIYAAVCKWILDAWSKVTPVTIIRGFARADIIPEFNTSDGIESDEADDSEDEDTGDTGSGLLDATTAQLMISNTEDEDF